jgi:hypothetical protein
MPDGEHDGDESADLLQVLDVVGLEVVYLILLIELELELQSLVALFVSARRLVLVHQKNMGEVVPYLHLAHMVDQSRQNPIDPHFEGERLRGVDGKGHFLVAIVDDLE